MVPGQSALEEDAVRRFDRTIRGKLYRGSLDKGTCCHNNLGIIPRHIPRFRRYIAVNRRRRLNALAERNNTLRFSKRDRLNDIIARLRAVRNHIKAQALIDVCRKDSSL